MCAEYNKAQRTAAAKVEHMCKGVEKGQNPSSDFNIESGRTCSNVFSWTLRNSASPDHFLGKSRVTIETTTE
ncbi:hypothetical protein OIU78_023772 [Salix suchowensis]|nr:hypothetical protein OIU78_023772 [Salix suchowensis]